MKQSQPDMLLVLLHHAGGSSFQYAGIAKNLPACCESYCPDLPGHGLRAAEPLLDDIKAMAKDIADNILRRLQPTPDMPYALFGHSMGGLLAYEASLLLKQQGRPPCRLFISSTCLPGRHYVPPHLLEQNDSDFWDMSGKHFGCIRSSSCDSKELQDFFVPLLRADLRAVLAHRPTSPLPSVECPLNVLYGTQDIVHEEDMRLWRRVCIADFSCTAFTGDHFYLFKNNSALPEYILPLLFSGGSTDI